MSCLIIKNDGIGDLILASGLISALGKHFNGNVDLITCSDNQEIAEGIEWIRNKYYISRDGIRYSYSAAKFGLLIPRMFEGDQIIIKEISSHSYDIVICLRRYIRQSTLVLMQKVHAKRMICAWEFPTNTTRSMAEKYSRSWEHYRGSENHLSELTYAKNFLEDNLGKSLSIEPKLSFCKKQTISPIKKILALGLGGNSTNWPGGNWINLARRLSSSGWKLMLFGGPNVVELANQIMMKIPNSENLVGKINWHTTAQMLSSCDGYIGNDTGLSHFASLIVRKSVIILGGGTFRRFFPWPISDGQHIIFHGLDCFDCDWCCKFSDRYCLSFVTPEDVECYFNQVMDGTAPKERDLNFENCEYEISWRRNASSIKTRVTPTISF